MKKTIYSVLIFINLFALLVVTYGSIVGVTPEAGGLNFLTGVSSIILTITIIACGFWGLKWLLTKVLGKHSKTFAAQDGNAPIGEVYWAFQHFDNQLIQGLSVDIQRQLKHIDDQYTKLSNQSNVSIGNQLTSQQMNLVDTAVTTKLPKLLAHYQQLDKRMRESVPVSDAEPRTPKQVLSEQLDQVQHLLHDAVMTQFSASADDFMAVQSQFGLSNAYQGEIGQLLKTIYDKAEKIEVALNESDNDTPSEVKFTLQKIMTQRLPELLQDYESLDPTQVDTRIIDQQQQKTATQVLQDQLNIINQGLDSFLNDLYQQDAQDLLVSKRYLEHTLNQTSILEDMNQRLPQQLNQVKILQSTKKEPTK